MGSPFSSTDRVVIVGGGIAGLTTALHLAPKHPVLVLAQAPLGTGASTPWAQGGVAAALGPDDAADLHAFDTIQAGAGLTDPAIAAKATKAASGCIEHLLRIGTPFDRTNEGLLALGLEAAHSRRRIVHGAGDGSGRVVLESLMRAARATRSIEIRDDLKVIDLIGDEDGSVAGIVCVAATGGRDLVDVPARAVVLATGGLGALYASTTNPLGATGSGLAMAARAGAVLRDLEFVQFHPTAIAIPGADPMPLATEALRGEGAVLVNGRGDRVMAAVPGGDLAPRDVVARAIQAQIAAGEVVCLDARRPLGERVAARFPGFTALCRSAGLDPAREPIPVRPAAHFHMGGIRVDERGRSSRPGLWACGEVASTGLHGANRLASNSLLEALAFARWIAEDVAGLGNRAGLRSGPGRASRPSHAADSLFPPAVRSEIRRLMDRTVGVVRYEAGLVAATDRLRILAEPARQLWAGPDPDLALVGLFVAAAALSRTESRGAHFRSDHPAASPEPHHTVITVEDAFRRPYDLCSARDQSATEFA